MGVAEGPGSGAEPEITVVVPTFKGDVGVRKLVNGLAQQTLGYDRWELILVDDGSGPSSAAALDDIVRGAPFPARVLHSDRNRKPAAARNLGWRASRSPVIAFTDDDCCPSPGWLESGLGILAASSSYGVVQGRTVRPPGWENYPYTRYSIARDVPHPSPWFEGCNLFWRREALEDVGGYDETIGFHGEETSAAWAALDFGWQRGWADDAVIEHIVEERPWRWHLRFQYLDRNIVIVAARHPAFRRSAFWRPWAAHPENALFAAGLAGVLLGARWRLGLLATVPYLVWLRKQGWKDSIFLISKHGASLAGKMEAGMREGILVL
jgi:glycosyltransferase involved in cell wall biosynthesis